MVELFIAASVVIFAIAAIARHSNRTEADKARPSWAVRGWNASGAPKVEAMRVLPGLGELAGRAAGALTRKAQGKVAEKAAPVVEKVKAKTGEAAVRAARSVTDAATRRWEERSERAPRLWQRIPKSEGSGGAPTADDSPAARRARAWDSITAWQKRKEAAQSVAVQPVTDEPADGDPDLLGSTDCPRCGTRVKAVIPSAQFDRTVTCGCGFRITFYRAPNDPPPDEAAPDQTTTDPARRNGAQPTEEDTDMTATTIAPAAPNSTEQASSDVSAYAPADWQQLAQRVANFHPESDAELINFMTGEVAGICGYAEAYEQLHEDCLNSLGLDPNSVQGLGEFAEHVMELTRAMTAAHQRFVTTYEEVMKAVANGVVLPYNGRWMTGEAV
ncbi:hypothetical protein ACIBG4_40885 [Nonomuraea sp. NPDC050383]|uniref:hypothetical protein n=1 Tax=Nonomuraea sp. NPDC050383 TaxID=3364362 RepID=UPI0037AA0929